MGFRRPGERPPVVLKPKWFPSSSTCELLNHIPSEPNVQAARVPDHYAGYLVKAISRRKKEINDGRVADLKAERKIDDFSVLRLCPTARYKGPPPSFFDQSD